VPLTATTTQPENITPRLKCQRIVGAFAGFDGQKVVAGPIACKSWTCPACQIANKADLYRRIFNGGVVIDSTSRYGLKFLTLTGGGHVWRARFAVYTPQGEFSHFDHIAQYEEMAENFTKLTKALRKTYGQFYYFRICELHKDGTPHFHVLLAGNNVVPKSILASIESLWCTRYGMGFVKLNTPKRNDGKRQGFKDAGHAVRYMLKYITKDQKSVGRYKRIFSASKGALLKREKKEWDMLKFQMGFVGDDDIKVFDFDMDNDGMVHVGGGLHRPFEDVMDGILKIEMQRMMAHGYNKEVK